MIVAANGEKINGTARPAHLFGTSVFDITSLTRWDGIADESHPIYQISRHSDGSLTLSYGARNLYATDASDGRVYQLVEDAASLVSGDTIIIVNRNEAQALSVFPSTNGRAVTSIKLPGSSSAEGDADVLMLRAIKTKDGKSWGLQFKQNGANAYLSASSAGNLTSVTKSDASCLGTIDIVDGNAVIKLGTGTRGTLTYFTDNTRISCTDGSTPSGLSIYRLTGYVEGIHEVVADGAATSSTAVFTLSGRYVGESLESLPSGIYVVNGKKVMR